MMQSRLTGILTVLVLTGGVARAEAAVRPFLEIPAFAAVASNDPIKIDWRTLGALDLVSGKAPASLQALDGKVVQIAAFIVPLEDDMQESDEFLLVPYFGACVHTPPPPPNQMVYVKMRGGKSVKIGWWDPVLFEGVLRLKQVESPYGASYYEMEGITSKPYKPAAK
jgi:hypothetical protein